jgi:hypothetical protein
MKKTKQENPKKPQGTEWERISKMLKIYKEH